jgi:hypothetical protein
MRDRFLARTQPPAQVCPGVWVRHPTISDVVDIEDREKTPGFIGWYLVRFMCWQDGSPVFAPDEEEHAGRVHAAIAQKVIEKVGQLMHSPPDFGEAGSAPSRLEIRPSAVSHRVTASDGLDDLGAP